MSKELPFFRFTPTEWLNGDISLEPYEVKGVFSDILSYYWFKDCKVTQAMLKRRFSVDYVLVEQLFKSDILKIKEDSDFIEISFLDEQFEILLDARKRRQEAGRKGGRVGKKK